MGTPLKTFPGEDYPVHSVIEDNILCINELDSNIKITKKKYRDLRPKCFCDMFILKFVLVVFVSNTLVENSETE